MRLIGQYYNCNEIDREFEIIDKDTRYLDFADWLPKNYSYSIGIDQSTKCTGITFLANEERVYFTCQIFNSIFKKKLEEYATDIIVFIRDLADELILTDIYIEDVPPIFDKSGMTLAILRQLLDKMSKKLELIYGSDLIRRISPVSWQSKIYVKNKSVGSSMRNKDYMAQCVLMIEETLLTLYNYIKKIDGHDFDAFDSYGIVSGGKRHFYDEDGNLRNVGQLLQTHAIYISYIYSSEEEIEDRLKRVSEMLPYDMIKTTVYNEDKSVYENLVIAGSLDVVSILHITEQIAINCFLAEFNKRYNEDYILLAVVLHIIKNQISASKAKNMIEYISSCNKIIYPNRILANRFQRGV